MRIPSKIAVAFSLVSLMCGQDVSTSGRMSWFEHDKFGMFIHWGPYSALAGEWKGQQIPVGTEAEWIMQRFNIPVPEYRERAHQLNPTHFDAEEWVNLAKDTGMKYLVITAKHHDGFAMYRSKVSKYNIVEWTEFKRDPVKELSDACKKAGIRFCVYYSHREDWDDPNGYGNNWDYDRSKKNFAAYLETKSKPQLRELLTNYGPLGLVWFDRGMDTPEHAQEFVNMVHTMQPQCLVNGRVGNYGQELMGDYQDMTDNGMPPGGLDEYWETPQTLNGTWGYSKFDQQWKTPGDVIHRMVEIVGKGGNYLLNIGPMGDGTVPTPSVATLKRVGEWMRVNGESIYGSSASPLPENPWGRSTVGNRAVYLHVFTWPADSVLRFSGLTNPPGKAYLLSDRSHPLAVSKENGAVSIRLPAKAPDPDDSVVALEVAGKPAAEPKIVVQGSDASFQLDYLAASTEGRAVKRFNRDGGFHISKWQGRGDGIGWHLLVSQAGEYRVRLRYAARSDWGDGRFAVSVAGQSVEGKVVPTGDWYKYNTVDLGTLKITKAGPYTVTIQPVADYTHNLMYFQSLTLEPVL